MKSPQQCGIMKEGVYVRRKYFGSIKILNEKNQALIDENEALKEQLQNAELLEKFNKGLANIKANGEYDKILAKYGY